MTSSYSFAEITILGKQMWQFWYKNVLVLLHSFIADLASGLWRPKQAVYPFVPLQAALSGLLHCFYCSSKHVGNNLAH